MKKKIKLTYAGKIYLLVLCCISVFLIGIFIKNLSTIPLSSELYKKIEINKDEISSDSVTLTKGRQTVFSINYYWGNIESIDIFGADILGNTYKYKLEISKDEQKVSVENISLPFLIEKEGVKL